jgi:hypothetical protein
MYWSIRKKRVSRPNFVKGESVETSKVIGFATHSLRPEAVDLVDDLVPLLPKRLVELLALAQEHSVSLGQLLGPSIELLLCRMKTAVEEKRQHEGVG